MNGTECIVKGDEFVFCSRQTYPAIVFEDAWLAQTADLDEMRRSGAEKDLLQGVFGL